MNEVTPGHIDFEIAELLKYVGYGLLMFVLWVLKKFGEQHLQSMEALASELKEMRKELNNISTRVTAVEIKSKMYHPEDTQ